MTQHRAPMRLYKCPHCGDVLSYPSYTYYWCPAIGRKSSTLNPEDAKHNRLHKPKKRSK